MFKNETLVKKIQERAKYKDEIDALKFKVEKLEKELKEDMLERDIEKYEFELDGDKHYVSYKVFPKTKFDTSKFKEDHEDLYKQYSTQEMSSRFSCK